MGRQKSITRAASYFRVIDGNIHPGQARYLAMPAVKSGIMQ